jgi:hypothetical protein
MFPLNTILAWNINIIMNKKYIITILLLPLGHISFSFWFRIAVFDGGGVAEVYLGKTPNPHCFQVRGYM